MKHEQHIRVEVNGKTVEGTITVDLPGIEVQDYLDAQLVLSAAASRQEVYCVSSRHNREREVRITALSQHQESAQHPLPQLRRVA